MSHEHAVPAQSRRALRAQSAEPELGAAAAALSRRELRALERAATAGAFEDEPAEAFAPVVAYEEPEPVVYPEPVAYAEPDPLESGSLIMPAGHTGTGPVTPVEAYGRPAVLLDAPVQPALPPLDELGFTPEPWRTNVGLAEPVAVPAPRAVPADEELSTWVEEDLMDVDQHVDTLAERLATLPVAPWAVDLELIEGGYVEHPCEPVDSVPHPHAPVGDRITPPAPVEPAVPPVPAVPAEPVVRALPVERAVPAAPTPAPTSAPTSAPQPARAPGAAEGWAPAGPAPTVSPSVRRTDAAQHGTDADRTHTDRAHTDRPHADRAHADRAHATDRPGTGEHALPKASEHIPSVKPWVVPGSVGDPLAAMRRDPGPMLATVGAWLGAAACVLWFLGPVALGIGAWTMNLARQHDYSRLRPGIAIAGGVLGTLMGVAFVLAWH